MAAQLCLQVKLLSFNLIFRISSFDSLVYSLNFPKDIDVYCGLKADMESPECLNRSYTPPQCSDIGSDDRVTDAENSALKDAYRKFALRNNASRELHGIGGVSSGDVFLTTSP